MNLQLQHPPTPENAAALAQLAVDAAHNVSSITLDYSPQSLNKVDGIIEKFHADGLGPDQIGSTIFSFGCYFGEVFVRHHGAVWKMPADTSLPEHLKADNNMMVVEFPNGDVWNPIGKAFKLLENGLEDSLAYSYQVAIKDKPEQQTHRPWWKFWK